MAVRIEKDGSVWTVIHDRPEARNAMDPASAEALTAAFLDFDADESACVAVFYGAGGAFCAGWDLKYVSTLNADYPLGELDISTARPRGNGREIPRGPLGPSRLELDKPVIAAIEGPVYIDLADDKAPVRAWLAERGFTAQRPLTRMLHGRQTGFEDVTRTFAVAGPELG